MTNQNTLPYLRESVLRRILTIERWHQFTHEVTEAFRTGFGDVVEFTRDFLIGTGTKA